MPKMSVKDFNDIVTIIFNDTRHLMARNSTMNGGWWNDDFAK